MPAVIALSLLAALLFAASAAMQKHAVRIVAAPAVNRARAGNRHSAVPVVRQTRRLSRDPLWVGGIAANVSGSLVQAAALALGSVATVQVVLVTQLLFALPLGAVWDRYWPRGWDWMSGVAICGGLALFFAVPGTAPSAGSPHRWRVALAAMCAVAIAAGLVAVAARRPPRVHATLMAVAAGILFALSAVLMKVTIAELLNDGVLATAQDWVGYGLAVASLCGFFLEQEAFTATTLAAAVAAMTITNPVASYLLGGLAFQVVFPESVPSLAALTGSAALISAGVVGLAHSPVLGRDPRRPQ